MSLRIIYQNKITKFDNSIYTKSSNIKIRLVLVGIHHKVCVPYGPLCFFFNFYRIWEIRFSEWVINNFNHLSLMNFDFNLTNT